MSAWQVEEKVGLEIRKVTLRQEEKVVSREVKETKEIVPATDN